MLNFNKCISDVAQFHKKFGIDVNPLDDKRQYDLRVKRQQEEFDELHDAYENNETVSEVADAVIDIVYIAAGTVDLLGDRDGNSPTDDLFVRKSHLEHLFDQLNTAYASRLPLQALWDEVHNANMRKERGTEATSKYGNKFDIVKPAGWVGPNIAGVLSSNGIAPLTEANTWAAEVGLN
jgi:hypothetical protein